MKKNVLTKENKIAIVAVVVTLIVMMIGVSLAAFYTRTSQEGIDVIGTTCFDTEYTESSSMVNLAYSVPVSNEEGLASTPLSFTIKNKCDISEKYYVILNVKSSDGNASNLINSEYINVSLDGATQTFLHQYPEASTVGYSNSRYNKSYVLTSGVLEKGQSASHQIRNWINGNTTYNDVTGKSWTGKIVIYTTVNTSSQSPTTPGVTQTLTDKIRAEAKITKPDFTQIAPKYTVGENFIVSHIYDGYTNVVHDDGYSHEFTYNATTKQWEAPTEPDTDAYLTFSINENKENMAICYESGYNGKENSGIAFYKNGTEYYYEYRERHSCIRIGNIKTTDTLSFEMYSGEKDPNLNKFNFYLVDNYIVNDIESGVFAMEDDYGMSYYFRGGVDNNYVKFGDFYWRIVRLNGDGTLRIAYDGTTPHPNGDMSPDRALEQKAFNSSWNNNAYVGYMYGDINGTTYDAVHKSTKSSISSTIKTYLDSWYETNIRDKGLAGYVSDTSFCNDRSLVEGTGVGTTYTSYGAYGRLEKNNNPSLVCPKGNDMFTVESKTVNSKTTNGALTYPIGLLTADEYVLAGGKYTTSTINSYLNKPGINWHLGSPYYCDFVAYGFAVFDNGNLFSNRIYGAIATVPVINLSAEAANQLKGSGTTRDPYHF